ncbi:unnamed protein product [Brachionus calyciflorus]|uniref:PLAT domain-containing protein n=1 Tax=Brachionus calyciflorus TaxID=104777 RepID=A0A813LZR5_9BILA|nr:unnamed protein product [Brachionus calyciflorus]
MIKSLFLYLTLLFLLKEAQSQIIDLVNGYDQFIVGGPDPHFTYFDSYFNNCISKIDYCSKGITGAFILTILYSDNFEGISDAGYDYGRIVLYSTGAESPYSRGGVYLHQINVRGDNFLEFGLTQYDNLYTTRIYLNHNSSSRIGYVWDKTSLRIYVDGLLYDNIQSPKKRSFLDLGYNPFKTYKIINSNKIKSHVSQIFFIESVADNLEKYTRGDDSNYLIGCYESLKPLSGVNNLIFDTTKPFFLQCKELCRISLNKYSLLNEDKCICLQNDRDKDENLKESACSDASSWQLYLATNLNPKLPYKNLEIDVERVVLKTPIELGDPIGIQLKSNMDENYLLSADFGQGRIKTVVGNNFLFDEFYETGQKTINVSAYSLSDKKRYYQKVVQFNINSIIDREPMNSVNLKVDIKGERLILVTVNSAGGLPYTCFLSFGDSSPKVSLEPINRIQTFIKNYTYQFTGLYNISVNCLNRNGVNNEVSKSMLIYLPNQNQTNFYSVLDNSYFVKTYNQIILPRQNNSDIELPLPFTTSTQNLTFKVVDLFNKENKFEFVNSQVNTKFTIRLKTENLKNFNENYFQIQCEDLILGSYLIILEDQIDLTPRIKVLNKILVENKPVPFEIAFNKTSNALIKVEYGDGSVQYFSMYASSRPNNVPYILNLNHTYSSGLNYYTLKITIVNHINKFQASQELFFETSLPIFTIKAVSEIPDVNRIVNFTLSTNPQNDPVKVDLIQINFDSNNKDNFRLIKNYTFSKLNSFSLDFAYSFTYHGYFDITVNCSNPISYQIALFRIKVGTDLKTANGIILNNYANKYENIYFKININGGNGYNIIFDYDDGKSMQLPWQYIISNGTRFKDALPGYKRPNAIFNNSGIYVYYPYSLPGLYAPKVKISNPFKEIEINFCTKIEIVTDAVIHTNETMDPYCFVSSDNIDLYINNSTVKFEQILKIAKGIPNYIETKFSLCTDPYLNQLTTRWVLMKIPVGKSIDYEDKIEKYCLIQSVNNQFLIEANELEFGNYSLRVYSYRNDEPQNYVRHGVYLLKVETSPIRVNLNDGIRNVELHLDQDYLLNFYDKTYDPDSKVLSDKTDFIFYFVCIQDYFNRIDFIKSIQNSMFNLDVSLPELNLAFYSDDLKVYFYERECFKNRPEVTMEKNPISIRDKSLLINGNTLLLNQSLSMSLQLYVQKKSRISVSQQMMITMNMSKLFAISLDSDFDEINEQLNKLNNLVQQNPQKALNILTGFAEVVNNKASDPVHNQSRNSTNGENVNATQEFSNIRFRMLDTVGNIVDRVGDGDSILTAAKTVGSVSSNPNQMPTKNQETGSMAIEKMGDKTKDLRDPELVNGIAESILDATGNTFNAAVRTVPVVQDNSTDLSLLEPEEEKPQVVIPAKITAPLEYYEREDTEDFPDEVYEEELAKEEEIFQQEEEARKQTANVAKRTFNGISGTGLALAATNSNGSNMTKIEQKGMSLIVGKKNLNESESDSETEFSTDGGLSIVMPVISNVVNTSNSSMPPSIVTSMIASAENPLQSSKSKASGMIVSLKLTDETGCSIVVNNTKEPFNIKIPSATPAPAFIAYVNQTGINYHKLFLATNSSSLHVVIIPETPGDIYHIYIKYSETKITSVYPDEKNHDYAFTSPDLSGYYTDPSNELMYTAFISNNDTKGNGTYYIGVKLAMISNETRTMLNKTNTTEYTSYYKIRIFSTSCKYWKEDTAEWSTDGCYVGANTIHNMTECLCYHLTTFGTDFYVPPNTIDFSTVFGKFKDLSENAAVFATIVSLIGLYILMGIFVRWKDRKDLVKWGATPLADNLPVDNYFYLVSVQTGVGKSTGTTSKVGFVLSGDQADSGVRKLSDDKRKAFKAGSICNFIMGVEEPLGSLQYLRIWHDNSGKGDSKSWYLNMITVIDLQTNQKSNFVCNQWFAVEKGDGLIDRVVPEACQNDLVSFKHLFTQSVKKKFTDSHLWFSVFARPTKSSFTRLQRLSCCMSLLFTTMIANAMFYKSEENTKNQSGVLEIGPIKFTMTQLYTSIISTLIVVPVNLIIVTLFRKAKLKRNTLIKSRRTGHVAKQQFWRRVKQIENIELPDHDTLDHSTYFNIDYNNSQSDFGSRIEAKPKKSIFDKLFKKEKNFEYKRESKDDVRNKKQGRNLPHWVIYIGWFLVFVSILVPGFFVILYSMQWGKQRSEAWLTSLFMSFFQSLFIIDPLKVFIITAVITWILKKPDDEDDSLIDSGDPLYNAIINHDEEYLHTTTSSLSQIDIREIIESRRSKLTTLKPVEPEELERQRIERKNSVKLKEIMREAASYLSFFVVVLFLSYQARSKNSYYVHQNLANMVLNNREMAFEDIVTHDDLWNYIEKVFVPSMYAPVWYNDKKLNWREKLTSFDRYSIRVGAPRIRQLRIKENTCKVNSMMSSLIVHCRDDYNWIDDDTKDYDVGWKLINGTLTNSSSTTAEAGIKQRKTKWKCKNAWCYQSTLQTKSTPILGRFTTYKGGGYAVSLGRTLERTTKLLSDLKKEKWIDELTRAVFMEFSVYNPNVNLFSSGTLIVEYLSTGAAATYQAISVFSLYSYLGSFGIIVLIFEIIFIIYIVYFIVIEILKLKKQKCQYFKQFWNLNEFVIISFSIVSMAMFIMRAGFTKMAIKAVFESEMGEFVNFNTIALWDETFNGLSAIVVFCATLKFMKLLRFNKHIGVLAATLKYACGDLLGFSCTFGIIFMAFTQFGVLIFGDKLSYYKDFMSSLATTFRFSLGQFNLGDLHSANFVLGSVYFVLFILLVIMGLMSMFITILDQAYHKVKEELESQENDMEIIDYFFDKIKNIKKSKNKKIDRKMSTELSESDASLKVNVKLNDKDYNDNVNNDQMYSASFKSLNVGGSISNYESHDSMSLY